MEVTPTEVTLREGFRFQSGRIPGFLPIVETQEPGFNQCHVRLCMRLLMTISVPRISLRGSSERHSPGSTILRIS
jgi:hypothetical protein